MIKRYTMDVYPRSLYVAVNATDEEILKFLNSSKDKTLPPIDNSIDAYVMDVSDGKHGGVLMRFSSIDSMTPGVISHECLHVIMKFCHYLGITFNTCGDDEHIAYMLEWAVNKVYSFKESLHV